MQYVLCSSKSKNFLRNIIFSPTDKCNATALTDSHIENFQISRKILNSRTTHGGIRGPFYPRVDGLWSPQGWRPWIYDTFKNLSPFFNIGAEFEATRCGKSSVPNQRRRSHETVVVFVRRLRYISSQERIFAEEERKVICDSETLNVAVMKLLPREKLFSPYNKMVRAVGYSHAYSNCKVHDTP